MIEQDENPVRALVVHPVLKRETPTFSRLKLEEAVGLSVALGVVVVHAICVPVRDIRAGKYFGGGKLKEFAEIIEAQNLDLVIVNAALAPIQQRNLEKAWNVKVIDRTGLILEIFALRAATKEGRLQVELARLAYERSRLVRTWTHLERQRGGQGFLAGPGETQIEADRRMLADKIGRLRRDLRQVRRTRALQRTKRKRAPERVVALVGYTNAGKSSVFNHLTSGGVLEKDMLFATLDTTHRILPLPSGQQAVMSDTVGFISDLPTGLVEAFRATLEEVKEADLLIHVRDISDPLTELHKQDVLEVLRSIQAGPDYGQEMIEVWNKIDVLACEDKAQIMDSVQDNPAVFPTSCLRKSGLDALLAGIEAQVSKSDIVVHVQLGPKDMKTRAWLHENGQVLKEEHHNENLALEVRLSGVCLGRLRAAHPELAV